jgi:hypothetical protein
MKNQLISKVSGVAVSKLFSNAFGVGVDIESLKDKSSAEQTPANELNIIQERAADNDRPDESSQVVGVAAKKIVVDQKLSG